MHGQAPIRDAQCTVTGHKQDTLVFSRRESEAGEFDFVDARVTETDLPMARVILNDPHSQIKVLVKLKDTLPRYEEDEETSFSRHELVDLTSCAYSDQSSQDPERSFLINFEAIASYESRVSYDLLAAGFPKSVWESSLDRLTSARIDEIVSRLKTGGDLTDINSIRNATLAFERSLIAVVTRYGQLHHVRAQVISSESCGGDWIGYVKLATSPAGGIIKLIREFDFKLCSVSDADDHQPYSSKCDLWTRIAPETEIPQGTYYYQIEWPNASIECDRIKLITTSDDPETVTISSSGKPCGK
jgi:hypothetical protein